MDTFTRDKATTKDISDSMELTRRYKDYTQQSLFIVLAMALNHCERLQQTIAGQRQEIRKLRGQSPEGGDEALAEVRAKFNSRVG